MELKTVRNRVIVELIDPESVTAGGLVIPGAATEKPHKGKVVCTGPGLPTISGTIIPMTAKVGDTVMFAQNVGVKIKVDYKEYLTLVEDEILAIIEE